MSGFNPNATQVWKAYALLTGTTLCWGMNAILGKLAVGNISPMMLVSARWLAVLILIVLFMRKYVLRDWPVVKNHIPYLAVMGAIGFTCFNALFYVAAHDTTAINIGIVQGSIPIFVMIGAFIFYRDRITSLQFGGVLITLVGVIVATSAGSIERLMTLRINDGDLLMLCACFLYAAYAIGLRKRPPVSPLAIFPVMSAAAFVVSLPFLFVENMMGAMQWPTPMGWLVVALVSVFPSFLAQIFFIQGVDILGPGRAGVFANLVPVFASIMAVIVLGEIFEAFHAIALALVLSGIWVVERFKAPVRAAA